MQRGRTVHIADRAVRTAHCRTKCAVLSVPKHTYSLRRAAGQPAANAVAALRVRIAVDCAVTCACARVRHSGFNASMVQRLAHGGWQLSRDELDVVFLDWFLFSRVN